MKGSMKGVKSHSYMKGGSSHGLHTPHNGGQTGRSMSSKQRAPVENDNRPKMDGGHKGKSGY